LKEDSNSHVDEESEASSPKRKSRKSSPRKKKHDKKNAKNLRDSSGSEHDTEEEENKKRETPTRKQISADSDGTEPNMESHRTDDERGPNAGGELGEIVEETSVTGSKHTSRQDENSSYQSKSSIEQGDEEEQENSPKELKSRPRSQPESIHEDRKDGPPSKRSMTESSKENDYMQTKRIDSANQINKPSDNNLLNQSRPNALSSLNEIDEKDYNSILDKKLDSQKGTPLGTSPLIELPPTMDLKQFVEKLKSM
jgi:hypothetical protein